MKQISLLLVFSLSLLAATLPLERGFMIDSSRISCVSNRQSPQDQKRSNSYTYRHLPMNFELNLGQVDGRVKFLWRGKDHSLFLTPSEAILQLTIPDMQSPNGVASVGAALLKGDCSAHQPKLLFSCSWFADDSARSEQNDLQDRQLKCINRTLSLRMKLIGANFLDRPTGLSELPGKVHYLQTKGPRKQITNIPIFAQVRYEEVYPGIDLIFHGNGNRLEYDFVVSPGASPDSIRISFEGQKKLELGDDGQLVLYTACGEIRQPKPFIYQEE